MKLKKITALLVSVLMIATMFSACDIIKPQFADYDVSGYIKALFESSYLGEHEDFMAYAKATIQEAEEKNDEVVTNGAVKFCNAFDIYPSEEELKEIESIVRRAYKLSKFTVKEEQKSDTGYYVEVDIQPLLIFKNLSASIEQAREDAENNLLEGQVVSAPESSEESSEDDYYEDEYSDEDESSASEESSEPETETIDQNTAFIREVIKLCQNALDSTTQPYDKSIIVTLDIRQTDEGELQIDLNQVENIDDTVLIFSK